MASFVLAAIASGASAQGVGEITLDSSLNQPLRAHIALIDTADLDASQIQVALASQDDFAAAGIERNPLLNALTLTVVKGDDGADRIDIATEQKIDEPYLNFLVSVVWPNGRSLREYTLLLDLLSSNEAADSAVTNPPLSTGTATTPPPAAVASAPPADGANQEGYRVQQGDTLFQIAERTRPSQEVGVQQMMVALQRANEDAFVNNNINRILTGKVLRIPTQAEIALIDQSAASAQVLQQNQALSSQPLTANDGASNTQAPPRDELTLLSGNQTGGGSDDLADTVAALENELMLSEENLDRARLENLELTNRLAALQEQIDLLQNIIAIEDERVAQLQAELSKQSAETGEALAAANAAAESAASGGLVALLKNSVVALGALLAVALGVAGLLYTKRRRAEVAGLAVETATIASVVDEPAAKSGLAAMIATLMARFRRSDNDEDAELDDELDEEIAPIAAPLEVAAPAAAQPAKDTNKLIDEMGLGEEFKNLSSFLDEVDNEAPVENQSEPVVSDSGEEAAAAMAEADLLSQALSEAEQQSEQDFLQAPAATNATPDSFSFSTATDTTDEPAVAAVEVEETPEVFEFTLPGLEDSISENEASASPADDSSESLEVLSFDENSVISEEGGDEQGYTPADSQDPHDARLDLAVAYEAMGDIDGALEILEEIITTGRPTQVAEAERLKQKWQNS